jgi:hypothetical protein
VASKGNKPGFIDTFRYGWIPADKRVAATQRDGAGGAVPAAAPKGAKPAPGRRGKKPAPGAAKPRASKASPALLKQRDRLSRQFAELQWDLGGIAYEMARRDSYRLEVLNAQAAKLQEVDAELGQIERLVKMDEAGAAGSCPACGALQARGASFCWRCGQEVKPGSKAKPKPAAAPPPEAKPIKAPKAAKLRRPRSSKTAAKRRAK